MGIVQGAKTKAVKAWSTAKMIFGLLTVWGLVYSIVTIGGLRSIVNSNYDLEEPKLIPYALAWAFRVFGFRITILANRPEVNGAPLRKEWRHLAGRFVFAGAPGSMHAALKDGNYVIFFGDSDTDITEGRLAKVYSIRVRRSRKSSHKEDYHPGSLGELVIPYSEY
ncbi:MAG: hypothetical protein NTX64_18185 [Elusimicrobia bacterium]|nr:hypothetical protein [Elusimicrobiota bacterium]